MIYSFVDKLGSLWVADITRDVVVSVEEARCHVGSIGIAGGELDLAKGRLVFNRGVCLGLATSAGELTSGQHPDYTMN